MVVVHLSLIICWLTNTIIKGERAWDVCSLLLSPHAHNLPGLTTRLTTRLTTSSKVKPAAVWLSFGPVSFTATTNYFYLFCSALQPLSTPHLLAVTSFTEQFLAFRTVTVCNKSGCLENSGSLQGIPAVHQHSLQNTQFHPNVPPCNNIALLSKSCISCSVVMFGPSFIIFLNDPQVIFMNSVVKVFCNKLQKSQ